MTIYMIKEIDDRFIIATGEQDVLACADQTIAMKVAALAVVTKPTPRIFIDAGENSGRKSG